MTVDQMEAVECLDRIIKRCNKVIREADQAILDIGSLQELHAGDAEWSFLAGELKWWQTTRGSVYCCLKQALERHDKHTGRSTP